MADDIKILKQELDTLLRNTTYKSRYDKLKKSGLVRPVVSGYFRVVFTNISNALFEASPFLKEIYGSKDNLENILTELCVGFTAEEPSADGATATFKMGVNIDVPYGGGLNKSYNVTLNFIEPKGELITKTLRAMKYPFQDPETGISTVKAVDLRPEIYGYDIWMVYLESDDRTVMEATVAKNAWIDPNGLNSVSIEQSINNYSLKGNISATAKALSMEYTSIMVNRPEERKLIISKAQKFIDELNGF